MGRQHGRSTAGGGRAPHSYYLTTLPAGFHLIRLRRAEHGQGPEIGRFLATSLYQGVVGLPGDEEAPSLAEEMAFEQGQHGTMICIPIGSSRGSVSAVASQARRTVTRVLAFSPASS